MRRLLVTSILATALWAVPAFSDTYGPPFGANSYKTSIVTTGSVEDADDYVAPLLAGETLTVTASANRASTLLPTLSLVAPSGVATALTPPDVVEKKNGSVVTLSRFPIPTTGRWTVRVAGKNGTQGAYTVAFSVGAVRAARPAKLHLGGAAPLSRDIVVDGIDGALLAVTVTWPKSQAAVHIGAVKDPSGVERSTGAPPVERRGSAKLTRRALHQGAGPYTVRLSIDSGEVDCSVTTTVKPQSRPRGTKAVALSSTEPFLDARATPLRGDVGLTAHLTGSGFTATPSPPQVFFGGVPGTGVVVAADGTWIDVTAPSVAANTTVEVVVVAADGQASARTAYFLCVAPPTITDVTDASGASVLGGSTAGGAPMTLVGTGFVPGDVVRFGGRPATGVVVDNSTRARLWTPAGAAGMVAVTVEDEFARTVVAPFEFEYKDAPVFAASPYSPGHSLASGGTTITITGTGFESTDRLMINGMSRNSAFVSSTMRQFTTIAASPGLYRVQLVDRLGVVATGPDLDFKDPPAFASYSPAAGPTAGGATITITGTSFESADTLRFNGSSLTSAFIDSTTRRFTSPALPAGVYSVDLTDRYGVQVSGPAFEIKNRPAFSASPYSPAMATSAAGTTVTITGSGFESTDQLRINGAARTSTFVDSTTRRFDTIATAPGLYSVQLVDRLGQVTTGPNFEIRNPPAFASTPYSPAFAGTAGGTTITITGTGFESTDQLRFNGSNVASTFVDSTTRTFKSPAIAAGSYAVQLVDRFNAVVSGANFDVKDPPTFASPAYSPAFAGTAGGTTVTVTGTGFESADQLRFNGASLTSTFVNSTTRRFNTPAIGAGDYFVELVDRFNRTVTGPKFEIKNPPGFAASPYAPAYGSTAGGVTITITGTGFESTDQLRFNGADMTSTLVSSTSRRFTSPAAAAGFYSVQLIDRLGQASALPNFEVRAAPAISNVQATAGPRIDATHIARGGGATIHVTGARFAADNVVTFGGAAVTFTSQTSSQFAFTAPFGVVGAASLVVSDAVGQTASSSAISYVGFDDQTVNRQPGSSSVDDFVAERGAVGDLDNDGVADDLVITTDYSVGSRYVHTRILFAEGGALTDVTDSNFPGVSGSGDPYDADAVAIGDLDGDSVQDIVIAGSPVSVYGSYYREARMFTNDGRGTFTQSSASPQLRQSAVTCTDRYGSTFNVFTPNWGFGSAGALAIGDLDADGDMDLVMATDRSRSGNVFIQPNYVTFTPGAYYDADAWSHYSGSGTYSYTSATRVFDNQGGSGFVDETFPRMPLCGTSGSPVAGFPGRDVKLGDIDGDGSLDMVVTWDDPTTVSPYGQSRGSGVDSPRVSTQILINDGRGFFADQTSTWLPAGSSPEFWQGNRVELVDLDGDGRKDLVVLHAQPLDGSTTSRSSLRILRNAGASQGFVEITSSALPSVPLSGTADDNLRGTALLVRDVDGDGNLDVVVGTTERLLDSSGNAVRSTRLLRGDGALQFALAGDFLPAASSDTGEVTDLLIGDVSGNSTQSLILLSDAAPAASANGERLRVFDWR